MSDRPYTVVVGIGPRSNSPAALRWAQELVELRHGRLVAVRAWRAQAPQATPSGTTGTRISRAEDTEAEARRRLDRAVTETLGDDHGVDVRLVRGGRRKVLLAAAAEADLLVLDAPRAGYETPMFAHRVLRSARCPVVLMPPRIAGAPPSALATASRTVGRAAVRSAGMAGRPGLGTPRTPTDTD